MNPTGRLERRYTLLKRLATLCVVLVLAIASLSAFIRLTNAGLGCADWPQCYGAKLRQAQQGLETKAADSPVVVTVRMMHRVTAVAALILILAMLLVCFAEQPLLRREGRTAMALLALALFLAVLGRWSSGVRLPAVAIGNLLAGFALLALSWRLRQQVVERGASVPSEGGSLRVWAGLGLAVLLCQIALGGLVSAAYAGLSCTGFPDCGASSPQWWSSLEALNPWHEPQFLAQTTANPAGAAPHMVHRIGALALLLVLLPLGLSAFSSGRRRVAIVLFSLLFSETVLGVLMVTSGLPLWAELGHNLGAGLLLVVVVSLATRPPLPTLTK